MRLRKRIPLLPIAIGALAASLAGCYTLLKHPDISNAYEFDGEQETLIASRCGDCHAPPLYYRRIPYPHLGDDDREETPLRPIDPSTPARISGGGIAPTLPPGTSTTAEPATDTKQRDEAKEAADAAAEPVKKDAAAGKTPVRRSTDEKSKESSDENKTTDKKREQP